MELNEIENVLKKSSEGNFQFQVDENKTNPGLRAVAQMLNRTLEKATVAKELKHRADVMIQYNPMAIAIIKKRQDTGYISTKPTKNLAGYPRRTLKKETH